MRFYSFEENSSSKLQHNYDMRVPPVNLIMHVTATKHDIFFQGNGFSPVKTSHLFSRVTIHALKHFIVCIFNI